MISLAELGTVLATSLATVVAISMVVMILAFSTEKGLGVFSKGNKYDGKKKQN